MVILANVSVVPLLLAATATMTATAGRTGAKGGNQNGPGIGGAIENVNVLPGLVIKHLFAI